MVNSGSSPENARGQRVLPSMRPSRPASWCGPSAEDPGSWPRGTRRHRSGRPRPRRPRPRRRPPCWRSRDRRPWSRARHRDRRRPPMCPGSPRGRSARCRRDNACARAVALGRSGQPIGVTRPASRVRSRPRRSTPRARASPWGSAAAESAGVDQLLRSGRRARWRRAVRPAAVDRPPGLPRSAGRRSRRRPGARWCRTCRWQCASPR